MDETLNYTERKDGCSECTAALQVLTEDINREFNSLREEIRRPRRKIWLMSAVVCFIYVVLFFVLATIFIFTDFKEPELTENNTIELTATISKIQPIPYCIKFEEYNATFDIYYGKIVIDMDGLGRLTAGQEVVFRIKKEDAANISKISGSIELVALKGLSEIITLSSYNDYYSQFNSGAPTIIFYILGTVFLTFAFFCLIVYKRKSPKKRQWNNDIFK